MKVGIDLTALTPRHTGVDQFLIHLVQHLARLPSECRFYVFVNREDVSLFRGALPGRFVVYGTCLRPRFFRLLFQQIILPLATLLLRLEVVHSPSFIMPIMGAGARHVVSVHDLTTMALPDVHIPLRRSKLFSRAVTRSIRKADAVCVPSQFVRDEIERHIDGADADRIHVIPYGIGEEFTPEAADRSREVAEGLGISAPYILYVGNIDPRKNLDVLLRSYRELAANGEIEEHLVIAGPLGWSYDDVLSLARTEALRDRVHLPGYIPEADLPALMAGARLFVYPSQQEGFGFPPLEAMACGVPVVASDSSSLAENLGGAALLVPVNDEATLRDEMRRVLGDEALRGELTEKGLERAARFTWEATAWSMLACYGELHRRAVLEN